MAESKTGPLILCGVLLIVVLLGVTLATEDGRQAFQEITGLRLVLDEYDVVFSAPGMPGEDQDALIAVAKALGKLPDVERVTVRSDDTSIEVLVVRADAETAEMVGLLLDAIPEAWDAHLVSYRGRGLDIVSVEPETFEPDPVDGLDER